MPTPNTPNANTQRYPGFEVKRFGRVGERGSYTLRFKLRAIEFTRAVCESGNPVGKTGAGRVLGVDRKRIISCGSRTKTRSRPY